MASASRLAAATVLVAAVLAGCAGGDAPAARQATTPPSTTPSPTVAAAASPSPVASATPAPAPTRTATPTPAPPLTADEYLTRRRETGAAIGAALQSLLSAQGGAGDAAWRDARRTNVAELRQRLAEARALQPPACLAAGRQLDLQGFALLDAAAGTLIAGIGRAEAGAPEEEVRRLVDEAATALRAALAPLRTADVSYDAARC